MANNNDHGSDDETDEDSDHDEDEEEHVNMNKYGVEDEQQEDHGDQDLPPVESLMDIPLPLPNPANTAQSPLLNQASADLLPQAQSRVTQKQDLCSFESPCDCGEKVTEEEIEISKTVMQCQVQGCETIWVSLLVIWRYNALQTPIVPSEMHEHHARAISSDELRYNVITYE